MTIEGIRPLPAQPIEGVQPYRRVQERTEDERDPPERHGSEEPEDDADEPEDEAGPHLDIRI